MATLGRPRKVGAARTPSGHASRSRASLIASGDLVYEDWAVYFATRDGQTKIGFSGQLRGRMSAFGAGKARLIAVVRSPSKKVAVALEKKLHERFEAYALGHEWFDLGRRDITAALADCAAVGFKVNGGVDATDDLPMMSGLAYSPQRDHALHVKGCN